MRLSILIVIFSIKAALFAQERTFDFNIGPNFTVTNADELSSFYFPQDSFIIENMNWKVHGKHGIDIGINTTRIRHYRSSQVFDLVTGFGVIYSKKQHFDDAVDTQYFPDIDAYLPKRLYTESKLHVLDLQFTMGLRYAKERYYLEGGFGITPSVRLRRTIYFQSWGYKGESNFTFVYPKLYSPFMLLLWLQTNVKFGFHINERVEVGTNLMIKTQADVFDHRIWDNSSLFQYSYVALWFIGLKINKKNNLLEPLN